MLRYSLRRLNAGKPYHKLPQLVFSCAHLLDTGERKTMSDQHLTNQIAGDALIGCEDYVDEMFGPLPEEKRQRRTRQINHLLVTGQLPGRKAGKFWIGSRAKLRAFLAGEGA
jgi:hypothetical protein